MSGSASADSSLGGGRLDQNARRHPVAGVGRRRGSLNRLLGVSSAGSLKVRRGCGLRLGGRRGGSSGSRGDLNGLASSGSRNSARAGGLTRATFRATSRAGTGGVRHRNNANRAGGNSGSSSGGNSGGGAAAAAVTSANGSAARAS